MSIVFPYLHQWFIKRVKRKFFADFVSVLHDLNIPKIIFKLFLPKQAQEVIFPRKKTIEPSTA